MKKIILFTLFILVCSTSFADKQPENKRKCKNSSHCATRDASVLSIMGWGIALFAGIAVLCSLIENNPAPNTTTPQ